VIISSLRTLLYNVHYTVHVILILVYLSFVMHFPTIFVLEPVCLTDLGIHLTIWGPVIFLQVILGSHSNPKTSL
jgi:hypothetical protein